MYTHNKVNKRYDAGSKPASLSSRRRKSSCKGLKGQNNIIKIRTKGTKRKQERDRQERTKGTPLYIQFGLKGLECSCTSQAKAHGQVSKSSNRGSRIPSPST